MPANSAHVEADYAEGGVRLIIGRCTKFISSGDSGSPATEFEVGSYVAYYGDKTPKEALDAQRPRIRRLWGLTTQVGGARLIIERCTKFVSLGDSESPVTDFEVDQDAGALENCHCTNPDHGQGAFASSWRAGSEQD